ncbi:MAG TPA: hypothetical protein VFQ80_08615, partial [Thermomicrobiales bacterium]|nr:hypothetical protein [Thermomicrobiales bacterium]
DRRDADRRVREHVAGRYRAEAERVERVASQLAAARRVNDIGPVDELAQTIRHLADRIQTATYGYGGLFSDRNVDEAALDQLRLFDQGLLDGVDQLQKPISDLEQAFAAGGDLATPAHAGTAVARALLARFDLRNEVIETGKPAPAAQVLNVLSLPAPPPAAQSLAVGQAISILGDDFVVDAMIEVQGGPAAFRLFRLRQQPEEWLLVPQSGVNWYARLHRAAADEAAATIADGAYRTVASGSGEASAVGGGRSASPQPVRYALLEGVTDAGARALRLDWGSETWTLVGKETHPDDVEIYGQTGGNR